MSVHDGHRKRILARLREGSRMEDHELIEMLLFYAFPRINTNEIAHRLINSFGDIHSVFSASIDMLKTVDGIGDAAATLIYLLNRIISRIINSKPDTRPLARDFETFAMFLQRKFNQATEEYIELYVVKKNGVIEHCHRFTSFNDTSAEIPAPELINFIGCFNAKNVIVVHNHVHGDSTPSEEDIFFTKLIYMYLNLCGAFLVDHYIVSPHNVISFQREGLMKKIIADCSFELLLGAKKLE